MNLLGRILRVKRRWGLIVEAFSSDRRLYHKPVIQALVEAQSRSFEIEASREIEKRKKHKLIDLFDEDISSSSDRENN